VNFQHKTLSTWINSIVEWGLVIKKLIEPKPIQEAETLFPDKYRIYTKRPGYMILLCKKHTLPTDYKHLLEEFN